MADDSEGKLVFSYPVLDIIAITFAFLAIIIALYGIFKATQTAANTSDTVDRLDLTHQEIIKIRMLLEDSKNDKCSKK